MKWESWCCGDDQWSPDILLVSGLRWWNDAGIVITTKYSTKYTNTLIHSLVWQSGWEIIILLLGRINWLYLFIGCDPGSCEMLVTIFQPETRANNNQYPALTQQKLNISCLLWTLNILNVKSAENQFAFCDLCLSTELWLWLMKFIDFISSESLQSPPPTLSFYLEPAIVVLISWSRITQLSQQMRTWNATEQQNSICSKNQHICDICPCDISDQWRQWNTRHQIKSPVTVTDPLQTLDQFQPTLQHMPASQHWASRLLFFSSDQQSRWRLPA